jgi:hypothetical protein
MNDFSLLPVAFLLLAVLVIFRAWRQPRFDALREELSHRLHDARGLLARLAERGAREAPRWVALEGELSQLVRELKRRIPVYSAETVQGREAEFIRDRLPKRAPIVLFVVALLVFTAVAWWLSR